MANYDFHSVQLRTGSGNRDGRLVFMDGQLVAVLVLLADQAHGEDCGLWGMEADFLKVQSIAPLFSSPYDAVAWLRSRDSKRIVN